MTNRTRKIVLRVPVTPEERELIRQKMALLHTRNFSAYARKMLIDGYVVHIDTTDIRAQTAELQKIGVNVNQIARRLNSMGPLYTHIETVCALSKMETRMADVRMQQHMQKNGRG